MKKFASWAPWIFVVIWSSGFVAAKEAHKSADLIYFLAVRLIVAATILFLIALASGKVEKITKAELVSTLLIGICLHAVYLGGVWQAITLGAPAGLSSVITSLQPVFVSVIAVKLLSEKLAPKQYLGLVIGFVGVLAVVWPKLEGKSLTLGSLALLIFALAGSTSATLLQKKYGSTTPLLIGTTYQFFVAGIIMLVIAITTGHTQISWNTTSILAMSWSVLVTSIGAILLLMWLITNGTAAKVSSLLYLVPPMTAIQAFALFDEKVSVQGLIGIAMTALGVGLVINTNS